MRVFLDCTIIGFNAKEFNDKTTGEIVRYNEIFLKSENSDNNVEVVKLNTQKELGSQLDVEGVAEIEVDMTGTRKPKLQNFIPHQKDSKEQVDTPVDSYAPPSLNLF